MTLYAGWALTVPPEPEPEPEPEPAPAPSTAVVHTDGVQQEVTTRLLAATGHEPENWLTVGSALLLVAAVIVLSARSLTSQKRN